MTDTRIPERNMTLVETDERVSVLGRRLFRWRARRWAAKFGDKWLDMNGVSVATYHVRVERVGWLTYEVAAYQNRLVPDAR